MLPLAIDRWCVVAARPASHVRARSLDVAGEVELHPGAAIDPTTFAPSWGRYLAGVLSELAARGRPPAGADALIASDVPLGSGLSSSAALEVAWALALVDAADWELLSHDLAEACRTAEESATGVPCGIMDQLTSIAGVEGSALLIDCRSLDVHAVALPEEMAVLAVHSGIPRRLADSEYAVRRRGCEELARSLGLAALRDATPAQVADDPLGRHVVSENARVLEAAELLDRGALDAFGQVLSASHASLRDDFRISTPELDLLVEELVRAGALGARLTGGGFGGAVVAVCETAQAGKVAETATGRYRARTGLEPTTFVCRAVAGAAAMPPPAA